MPFLSYFSYFPDFAAWKNGVIATIMITINISNSHHVASRRVSKPETGPECGHFVIHFPLTISALVVERAKKKLNSNS